jgi:hypothetical protein
MGAILLLHSEKKNGPFSDLAWSRGCGQRVHDVSLAQAARLPLFITFPSPLP